MDAWLPKFILCLRDYNRRTFLSDLGAGITVGLVALPLAMAFAIASGVKPEAGLYCAIVTGLVIALLGGSRCQVSGPTGAFVVVIYGIVQRHGVDGLFVCTMMAGVLLLVLGLANLGTAVKYFPFPVVLGFTNGIAVIIASTQIKDFFGLRIDKLPGDFLHRLDSYIDNFRTLSPAATILAAATVAVVVLFARYAKRVPGSIVAFVLGTLAVAVLHLNVETIGSKFGGIPRGLPSFQIPPLRLDLLPILFPSAITVAMLGAIESLLSAVVADRMSGDRHNPNVELAAQGVGNIIAPLFGGLPATGAIARTATNIRSGAKTPVSAIIHALTLLLIVLFAAPLVKHVPLAVLAGILMVVCYNMGEWKEIPGLLKLSKADIAVWATTFGLTVFADLTVAVQVGMILAALLFIRKVSVTTTVSEVTDEYIEDGRVHILQDKKIPDYATVFRIHGPFLFGATDKLDDLTSRLDTLPPIVMMRLRNMTAIDATGLAALESLADKLHATGRTVILCGARSQPSQLMHQAEFEEHVGKDNICDNIQEALERAEAIYHSTPAYATHPHRRRSDVG